MPRVFESTGVLHLGVDRFVAGVALLADGLRDVPVDVLVGVARGGAPVARALGRQLDVSVVTVRASHNQGDAIRQQGSGVVSVGLDDTAGLDHGLDVLVCDDICGTGATLSSVSAALDATVFPRRIRTATLCRNRGAIRDPDMWLWDVGDWVVFPWEPDTSGASGPGRWLPMPTEVRRRT